MVSMYEKRIYMYKDEDCLSVHLHSFAGPTFLTSFCMCRNGSYVKQGNHHTKLPLIEASTGRCLPSLNARV